MENPSPPTKKTLLNSGLEIQTYLTYYKNQLFPQVIYTVRPHGIRPWGFVQNFGSRHSIPAVLDGSDVLVTAQTGSAFRRVFFGSGPFLTASPGFGTGNFRGASSEGSFDVI